MIHSEGEVKLMGFVSHSNCVEDKSRVEQIRSERGASLVIILASFSDHFINFHEMFFNY